MKRQLIYVGGLWILSFGCALHIELDLGASPWYAMLVGLSETIGATEGVWMILMCVVLAGINSLLHRKWPDPTIVFTILLSGVLVDVSLYGMLQHMPIPTTGIVAYLLFALGLLLSAIGIVLYLKAMFGVHPIDDFMLGVMKRWGWNYLWSRTLFETIVILAALLLGGPISVATLILLFATGPTIQIVDTVMKGRRKKDHTATIVS
ncbi:membrane protein (plasmid) [Pontibacillus sp. ALD_SL1]|uniref:YczE/YyaS/YitT family protein n=1 Tax=Pontibacillus sp. ALD_SL1 TaxID=2777185 RepID=UPI001A975676|nr:membrane protein [Pontibacillus sp. ALD_SL1]QST02479.1 membrane protein [Pontibacillus sp. ALD_SL1]